MQALIPWQNARETESILETFGGQQGFRMGNCITRGYTDNFDLKSHSIPFLGEIKLRHFRKSNQLQYQISNPEHLEAIPDASSIRTAALMGLVACVGIAFTVLRFCYQSSAKGKESQLMKEALIYS